MTTQHDLYDVLGISRDASQEDVKRAFRKLAMEFHPDRNQSDGAEERFKEVASAYDVLSDADKRSAYDRFGMAGVSGNGQQGFAGFDSFGGFGDIFDAFFRGTATRRERAQRGADLRATLAVDLVEAVFGTEREIEFERTERCGDCRGSGQTAGQPLAVCAECEGRGEIRRVQQSLFGQFVNMATCSRCRGEGKVVTEPCRDCRGRGLKRVAVKHVVKIPPGIDDGSQIRLSGEGEAGTHGGPSGHLYVMLRVKPHKQFGREEDDLIYDLPLNVAQAALGTTVEVPTLEGATVELDVEPGTQPGHVFVIRGKGVPHLRRSGRGDLLVRTHVVTPTELDDEQRELLERLAESLGTPSIPGDRSSLFDRIREAFS